jgi:hypothetical protein
MEAFKYTGDLGKYSQEVVILWPPESIQDLEQLTTDLPMTGIVIDSMGVACHIDDYQGDTLLYVEMYHMLEGMRWYEFELASIRNSTHKDVRGLLIACADEFNRCCDGVNPTQLMLSIEQYLRSRGWVQMYYNEEGDMFWTTTEPQQLIGD